MPIVLLAALQALTASDAPFDLRAADQRTPPLSVPAVAQPCPEHVGSDVVVCGSRAGANRYRLPLPVERPRDEHVAGDLPSTTAAFVPNAPCGTFTGERRCGKAEAREFGYGDGRDPITVGVKVADKLLHPGD